MEMDNNGDEPQKNKGVLGRLKKKLYTKGVELPPPKRFWLRPRSERTSGGWTDPVGESEESRRLRETKRMSFAKKFFISSAIFFIASLGISLFIFIGGFKVVSPENVEILVSGPVSIEAGGELSLQIFVENKNDTTLEFTDLIIEYPDGTRNANNLEEGLSRVRKTLGSIGAKEIVKTPETAILFGNEGESKEIKIILEYRIRDSNTIFFAEKKYTVFINASPVTLVVDIPREVNSGKEFGFTIEATSNLNTVLQDLLVNVDYPFGFSVLETSPKPLYGKSTWRMGDIGPGATRKIVIRGIVDGQDGEEKVFRVESGIPKTDDERTIGVVYTSSVESLEITRPFLSIELLFDDRRRDKYSVSSGDTVSAQLVWVNNLPTKIVDARIEARLDGIALDETTVGTQNGFYRSFDNTIIWDSGTLSALSEIESGGRGSVSFTFTSGNLLTLDGNVLKNPTIEINVDVRGKRLSESGVPEEIESTVSGIVKIMSDVSIDQRAVYSVGPFVNTGPIPPQVEKETQYTVIWTVTNTANPLSGGVVSTTLPPYVKWAGNVSPAKEEIVYIPDTRTVKWKIGNVKPGAGVVSEPRKIAFQIVLFPSISQLNNIPNLVPRITFTSKDEFAGSPLVSIGRGITTNLSTDPQFSSGDGRVVK